MANGHGGAREGAGRPPKAKEQELIEKLSPYDDEALEILIECLRDKQKWAVQLFYNYRYGKPVETQRVFNIEEQPLFPDV